MPRKNCKQKGGSDSELLKKIRKEVEEANPKRNFERKKPGMVEKAIRYYNEKTGKEGLKTLSQIEEENQQLSIDHQNAEIQEKINMQVLEKFLKKVKDNPKFEHVAHSAIFPKNDQGLIQKNIKYFENLKKNENEVFYAVREPFHTLYLGNFDDYEKIREDDPDSPYMSSPEKMDNYYLNFTEKKIVIHGDSLSNDRRMSWDYDIYKTNKEEAPEAPAEKVEAPAEKAPEEEAPVKGGSKKGRKTRKKSNRKTKKSGKKSRKPRRK
tara:strand:- start:307 stop:1104 length:798 start_codon:yes stop_codon:yes gene_type:complete